MTRDPRRPPLFTRLSWTLDAVDVTMALRVVVGLHLALVAILVWMLVRIGIILTFADEATVARTWPVLTLDTVVLLALAGGVGWTLRRWLRTGRRGWLFAADLAALLLASTLLFPLMLIDPAPLLALAFAAIAIVALAIAPTIRRPTDAEADPG